MARAFAWALMIVSILCGVGLLIGGMLFYWTLMSVTGIGLLIVAYIGMCLIKPK